VDLYARIASVGDVKTVTNLVWMFQAAGGLTYVFTAPYFYHSLLGLEMRRGKQILFLAIDVFVAIAAAVNISLPSLAPTGIILNSVLFAMIGYGLLLIAINLAKIADRVLKRALIIFFSLSLAFFPLLYMDAAVNFMAFLSFYKPAEGFSQPLYFLILNCLTVAFGLKYLNRPAYMADDRITDYFASAFGITRREREIVERLMQGMSSRDIGEKLFISTKTVENHIYSIYQKAGVRNRVQLFQLVKSNALK
jgi:DNA-binding CsgD family transcriptional regulator